MLGGKPSAYTGGTKCLYRTQTPPAPANQGVCTDADGSSSQPCRYLQLPGHSHQVGLFRVRRSRRDTTLPPRGKSVCLAFYGQDENSMPHSPAGFKREFQERTKDKGLAFHAFQHPLSLCPQTAWPACNPTWLHVPSRPSSCARCPVRRAWRHLAAKSTVICRLIY